MPAYPDGYDPCKDANGNPLTPGQTCSLNPIDDFNLKFAGARYVIDANDDGTGGQVVTAGPEILRKGFTVPPSTPNFGGDPFSSPVSPVFAHLPVGKHTVNVYVTMSERHCNGLTPVPTPALGLGPPPPPLPPGDTSGGAACLPKGESRYPILDNNEAEGGNKTVGLAFNVVLPTP